MYDVLRQREVMHAEYPRRFWRRDRQPVRRSTGLTFQENPHFYHGFLNGTDNLDGIDPRAIETVRLTMRQH